MTTLAELIEYLGTLDQDAIITPCVVRLYHPERDAAEQFSIVDAVTLARVPIRRLPSRVDTPTA